MVAKGLKKINEKSVLFFIFILLAVLVLGSLFFMRPKMTGFVSQIDEYTTQEDCENAGYTWEDLTNETCTDIPDCVECAEGCLTEGEVCVEGCVESCEECSADCLACEESNQTCEDENCVEGCVESCAEVEICAENCVSAEDLCAEGCQENCQNCTEVVIGGQCIGAVCGDGEVDANEECDGDDLGSHTCEEQGFISGSLACNSNCTLNKSGCVSCTEDWSCPNWATIDCVDGVKTRTCTDNNNCGTTESKPSETKDCSSESSSSSTTTTTGQVTSEMKSSCVSNWECGEWGKCVNDVQTRECKDTNNCVDATSDKPATSQSCQMPETCSDGIKNQDEKGIDCGGVCEKRCGFFTMVGSAINVPINSSREFIKGHKALSFSILGVIVLIAGWIVAVKVFLKKKNLLFFLENVHFDFHNLFNFLKKKQSSV